MAAALSDLVSEWNAGASPIIRTLSDDALACCFTWLPYDDLIRAACVSRTWRTIALANSSLWSTVYITRPPRPFMEEIFPVLMTRSSQPPRVVIEWLNELELIHPHIPRMRSLTVTFSPPSKLVLENLSAPYLEDLDVGWDVYGIPDAPLLRNLAVGRFDFPALKPCPTVVSFSGMAETIEDLRILFGLFPNLVQLKLSVPDFYDVPLPTFPLPPTLSRMTLTGWNVTRVIPFIQDLRRVALLTLDKWAMTQHHHRAEHTVALSSNTLKVDVIARDLTFIDSLQDAGPHLTHYTTIDSPALALFYTGVPYPNLRSLEIKDVEFDLEDVARLDAPCLLRLQLTVSPESQDVSAMKVLQFVLVDLPTKWTQHFSVPRLKELVLSGFPERTVHPDELTAIFSFTDNLYYGSHHFAGPVERDLAR